MSFKIESTRLNVTMCVYGNAVSEGTWAVAKPLLDTTGARLHVGDMVRQCNADGHPWADPYQGALWVNAGQTGTVVALGRTRAEVDFRRTKRGVWGTQAAEESVIDKIRSDMLTVVMTGTNPREWRVADGLVPQEGATTVTPLVAELWLRRVDPRTRPPAAGFVLQLVQVLTDPEQPNPHPAIAFDEDGVLIEGIHMLEACIQAGVTIEANVFTGVSRTAWMPVDSGS